MNNLSDIGFLIEDEASWMALLERVQPLAVEVAASNGSYVCVSDASGAQLWIQVNKRRELIGMNPHFDGPSRRRVNLQRTVERDSSPLDGGFYGWANPQNTEATSDVPTTSSSEEKEPEGDYPFVFDVPDFRVVESVSLPVVLEVQLTAFASDDFEIFDDEEAYSASQDGEVKFAAESFIPTGLFTTNEEGDADSSLPPQPYGLFAGKVSACERRQNTLTGEEFWWMAVETLGGAVDVVADLRHSRSFPRVGSILSGSFFLSARVIDAPASPPKPRFSWMWKRGQ